MSVEFFQTVAGKRYYEHHVPQIAKSLNDIAFELRRQNDIAEKKIIEEIANDLKQYSPALAYVLDEYRK